MALTLDGDNGVSGVNGSAGTPALQGTDTNTGISFGTDTVNLVTGGSTRATVDSSGGLGIGTTSPATKLHVSGAGTQVIRFEETGSSVIGKVFVTTSKVGIAAQSNHALSFEANNDEKARIDSSGNLLIGCTTANARGLTLNPQGSGSSPTAIFSKNNDGNANAIAFINAGSVIGTISYDTTSTAYNTSSDYRLKENVVPLTGAADRLNQLQVRRFNFIADPDTTVDGFIAHEAQAVVPECVTGTQDEVEVWKEGEELPDGVSVGDNKLDEDGNTIPVYQGIDQSKLVPLLTAALQEALAKIETLETRLTALEGGAS